MGIVVAKLVRLGKDGDSFKKDNHINVVRKAAKVDEAYVKGFNKSWEVSGQLYVIDKEATKKRDDLLNAPKAKAEAKTEAKTDPLT